ncbi:MAG: UvrD-helicase domain-containing protein [Sphingobacteriaceae bacterium]|nr:UvrD-helicase domain-containing protein [Sphingobacteriaceae bacterium]
MTPQKPLKILQASAGSGKTFSLTVHYLTLLFSSDTKYRDILAVTFTNKATEEMKSRILEVLKGFAEGNSKYDGYRDRVLAHYEGVYDYKSLDEKADTIYRKILHDYSRFSIQTIDGFVQKVVRSFAFELGLESGYGIEMNYDKIKVDLVEKLHEELTNKPEILQWIVDLSIEKIDEGNKWDYNKHLLELTGEIFKEGYQDFEDALNKIAETGDIDAFFKDLLAKTNQTIKEFERKISEEGAKAAKILENLTYNIKDIKQGEKSSLMKLKQIENGDLNLVAKLIEKVDNIETWFNKGKQDEDFYNHLNPALKKLIENYQNNLADYVTAIAFKKNVYYLRLIQEIALLLKTYREENENLLISDAQRLLQGITDDADQNPSFIWEKMGNRYRNFLFDEFQDTSGSQWQSFKSLLSNSIAEHNGKLIDHLIVGDTKQSIYRWRGGDANILHQQAKNDIGAYHVQPDSLEENYRSSEEIINFNNKIFANLPVLLQEHLNEDIIALNNTELTNWWEENQFNQLIPDVYSQSHQNTHKSTLKGGKVQVNLLTENDNDQEGDGFKEISLHKMLDEINNLTKNHHYALKDMCVLVRGNADASLAVDFLLQNEIDVLSGDALMISNNDAVKLLINILQMMVGIDQNNTLYKANCIALHAALQNKKIKGVEYLDLKSKKIENLNEFLPTTFCKDWQKWKQLPLPELVEKLMTSFELDKQSHHLPYLFAFRDIVGNFFRQGEKGIVYFLNYWQEEGDNKTLPIADSSNAVQVMTIHKSKGLAFRAVFVPFANWILDRKPNTMVWFDAENSQYKALKSIPIAYTRTLQDSKFQKDYFKEKLDCYMDALNTLYVASTRAIDYIYINIAKKKKETLTNIGDLLKSDLIFDENNSFLAGEVIESEEKKQEKSNTEVRNLLVYPTSKRLNTLFDANLKSRNIDLINPNAFGRMGTLLHDILAKTQQISDIDSLLDRMHEDGEIHIEEINDLKKQVLAVLKHPELQQLMAKSQQTLIEQSIVAADGKTYRPDMVLITKDGVIVLDYKFTQAESDKHIEQIDHYKQLLSQMGYQNIETYLFYAINNHLKKV